LQSIKRTILVILVIGICLLNLFPAAAQIDQPASKLQAADIAINQAFGAVLDAEKTGANVTDLLAQINIAQSILAQAENSYRIGNINTAATQADGILPIAQKIANDAQNAKQTAIVSNQNAFWSTITLTIVGVLVFVLVLFLVWRRFKRNYIEHLSEAKPEVAYS
jgi:hypothetical protein